MDPDEARLEEEQEWRDQLAQEYEEDLRRHDDE